MTDWKWGDQFGVDDDEENDDEGDYHKSQWGTKDGLIFLLDCTAPMLEKGDQSESGFELCIKCAKTVIQNKIISSDKDLLGIVFYGTEKDKNSSDFKHVYVLHDLDQPGAEKVLQLEALLEDPDNDDFKTKFGHSNACSLSDALWTCSNLFSNCSQQLGYKRVMLFTNNDSPHSDNPQLRRQAVTKVGDLQNNGIQIELMHMNKAGAQFDINTFYKDVLQDDEDENVVMPDASEKFEELLTRVRSKDHKKRALSRIPLSLGGDMEISVGIYNLVRTCTKPPAVKLFKKTNEEVKSVTKQFLQETGEVLMPQDMKKSQTYGGRTICFEKEEVDEIKKFDVKGLALMGFKPRTSLKRYFHVKPSQFIYPDESTVVGSTTLFTALLKKCLERDVTAICRYIPRGNTPPRFVALIPQEEELDEQNVQVAPPGFHIIFLPFADDFRKIKFEPDVPRANTDQIDKAKEVIKKLQFTFRSDNFENPALQQHYANVEAMALDRDSPDEVVDHTMPNDTMMVKRAGSVIQEFKDLVFPDGYNPVAAKKRGGAGGGGAAAKKAKAEKTEDIDVEAEAKGKRLGKLTVAVLKEYVKTAKINTFGNRKADLIDSINAHFGL